MRTVYKSVLIKEGNLAIGIDLAANAVGREDFENNYLTTASKVNSFELVKNTYLQENIYADFKTKFSNWFDVKYIEYSNRYELFYTPNENAIMPVGVVLLKGNKTSYNLSADGLMIQMEDSTTQTNVAGAYNGGGTGQKGFVGFDNYNNLPLSQLTALSFTARNIRDSVTPALIGNVYWNLLVNFNTGCDSPANEFANLVIDGLPKDLTKYFVLTNTHKEYTIDVAADRCVKVVGGTGVIIVTGITTNGGNQVTAISNIKALTVGMFFKVNPVGSIIPDGTAIPDGTIITAIDTVNNSVTVSNNATASGTFTLKQYGGVAPIDRTGTANGTTTVSAITNTKDLQVGMCVMGAGVLANTYIVSMVADTSITLNKIVTSGATILSFIAIGKTGIPSNNENVGIPFSKVVENNPNCYLANTTPTVPTWAAQDGGMPKNTLMSGINFIQGGSSITATCINSLKSIKINNDIYLFSNL